MGRISKCFGCASAPQINQDARSAQGASQDEVAERRHTARAGSAVELLHRCERVASHVRNLRAGGSSNIAAHMPAAHDAHMKWTAQRLIHWGQDIGADTGIVVTR